MGSSSDPSLRATSNNSVEVAKDLKLVFLVLTLLGLGGTIT